MNSQANDSIYKGVESEDGNRHVIPEQLAKGIGVQAHEPSHLCWCEPEFHGTKEDGAEVWYHRRVH